MKKVLSILFLFLLTGGLYSQGKEDIIQHKPEPGKEIQYNHEFGWAAGITTGLGISYRYWYQDWGVQLTFFPYIDLKDMP